MAFFDHPFNDSDVSNSILNDLPDYPEDADPDLVAFIDKFLCKDLQKRKEAMTNIRDDPFLRGINWEELEMGYTRPPFFVQREVNTILTRFMKGSEHSFLTY
ncbi:protein kinase C delta type-like [Rana temporaria]|uniref:protein kinase C delta type-like n=1 Tax=Rana temporaria TaxID=8407 RepID=UPI001AAC7D0D|nr:protein kinase C delta type-like [Rana temporaria]